MRYLSLFSGMEAAHLAWAPLGWECVGVAEVEPAACALLRHRLPHVPNLGNVTEITEEQIKALGPIDAVIGGSPCQDLSVAGRRAGLGGARSSLFHQQMRIFYAARLFCGARWLIWENVPGAFSSNSGRDFAVVVGAMAGCQLPVPHGGWGSEGVALGDNGLVEWSVLDAQWFGVAQRRRRVFAVLDTGDWASRPPVLLEPDSLRGDSAPRRVPGESPTGTLVARAQGGGGFGTDFDCQGGLVAGTLQNSGRAVGSVTQQDAHAGMLVTAFVQNQRDEVRAMPVAGALAARPGMKQQTYIAFGCKDRDPAPSVGYQVSPTLRAMGGKDGNHNAGGQVAVAYAIQAGALRVNPASGPDGVGVQEGHAYTIEARSEVQAVAYTTKLHNTASNNAGKLFEERTTCLDANSPAPALLMPNQVRRLTPRECERLQGALDDWTLIPLPGVHRQMRISAARPAERWLAHEDGTWSLLMADGPRYRMLGNSFAVPVIRWIGQRIDLAMKSASRDAA